jgi:hypothetical protein
MALTSPKLDCTIIIGLCAVGM